MKATQRLIDSVWTLDYDLNEDGSVTINSFSREDRDGYLNEKKYSRCALVEDEKRTVIAASFCPYEPFVSWASPEKHGTVPVANPKFIFSYGKA